MKKLLLSALILLPTIAHAQTGWLDLNGSDPSLIAKDGFDLRLGVQDDDDITFMVNDVALWNIDGATGTALGTLKQKFGSATALDADVLTATTAAPLIGLEGSSAVQSHLAIVQNVASAVGGEIMGLKTRAAAGSTNANTIIASGDDILKITAMGANGAAYDPAAQILLESGGTPGASADMPGRIRFLISPDSSATLTEAANFGPAGTLTMAAGITATTGNITATAGGFVASASGQTLALQEATAASTCMGTATANGTNAVTVSTTCALTASRIFISRTSAVAAGVTEPGCWATNIVNATSFDLDCNDAAENSTFNWIIFQEAA